MEIEEALTAYLLATPAITELIDRRLFPDEAPQNTALPYMVYIDISDIKLHTLSGQYEYESPMKQFTVYAETKSSAKAIARQVKKALKDFQGSMSGIQIQYIRLESELSGTITSSDGTVRVSTTDLEYEINFKKEE